MFILDSGGTGAALARRRLLNPLVIRACDNCVNWLIGPPKMNLRPSFAGEQAGATAPAGRKPWLARGMDALQLLQRVRKASDAAIPRALLDKIKSSALLEGAGERALRLVLAEAEWLSLHGGVRLKRDGDNDAALFVVLTGALGVLVAGDHGRETLVATIPAGETVGEMSLISGDEHSAALVALRDSELMRIGKPLFEKLTTRHPRVMMNVTRLLVRRLRRTTRQAAHHENPKTFAVLPLHEGLDCQALAGDLETAFRVMGRRPAHLDARNSECDSDFFHGVEEKHDVVIYRGDAPGSVWSRRCLRQADRVVLVASAGRSGLTRLQPAAHGMLARHPDLAILHEQGALQPGAAAALVAQAGAHIHHHIRAGNRADIARLARYLAGQAVSVVLSGGGARGFAHLGVLRALGEARVPLDLIGGASMGGIVAAGAAMEWGPEELEARLKSCFVDTNPLDDYTFPLFGLVRGRKVSRLLREHFGEIAIEDLPRNFFCCSSSLTCGQSIAHRSGPLWRALRASVAIPGILPPVIDQGQMLVDGGLMNNFPVDVMAQKARGPIIGVDVTGDAGLTARADLSEVPFWRALREGLSGTPNVVSILMRSGTVGNEYQRRQARAMADMLFEPKLDGIGLRAFKSFGRAIEEGYRHAVAVLETQGLPEALRAVAL